MAAQMEDIFVLPLVQGLLDKLNSDQFKNFGSEWEVQKELEELCDTLETYQAMSGNLEMVQTKDMLAKRYLKKLKQTLEQVGAALDKIIKEVDRKNRGGKHIFLDDKIFHEDEVRVLIKQLNKNLVEIENNLKPHYYCSTKFNDLLENEHFYSSYIKERLLETTFPKYQGPLTLTYGPKIDHTLLVQQLCFNLHEFTASHFDIRASVFVSKDFEVERLSRAIIESATQEICDLEKLEALQDELQKQVRGKKILLALLDVGDVKETSWDALKASLKCAKEGSRIILTTSDTSFPSFMNRDPCFDFRFSSGCMKIMGLGCTQ